MSGYGTKRSSSHARGRSAPPPTTDIRAVTSAFALISSAPPPALDVGGVSGKRLKLTQSSPSLTEGFGHYVTSMTAPVHSGWSD